MVVCNTCVMISHRRRVNISVRNYENLIIIRIYDNHAYNSNITTANEAISSVLNIYILFILASFFPFFTLQMSKDKIYLSCLLNFVQVHLCSANLSLGSAEVLKWQPWRPMWKNFYLLIGCCNITSKKCLVTLKRSIMKQ